MEYKEQAKDLDKPDSKQEMVEEAAGGDEGGQEMLVVKSFGLPSCPTSELLRIKRCTPIWSPALDYGRRHQMKQRGGDARRLVIVQNRREKGARGTPPWRTPCRRHLLASSRRPPPGPISLHHHGGCHPLQLHRRRGLLIPPPELAKSGYCKAESPDLKVEWAWIVETGKSTTR